MESRYELTDRADQDLFEASLYIARMGSTEAAEGFLRMMNRKFAILADNPGLGRQREELTAGLRRVDGWAAKRSRRPLCHFLPASPGGVLIVRVLHGSRDAQRAFGEAVPDEEDE